MDHNPEEKVIIAEQEPEQEQEQLIIAKEEVAESVVVEEPVVVVEEPVVVVEAPLVVVEEPAVVVEEPAVVVEAPVVQEKHVVFKTTDNEEITINLQENSSSASNEKINKSQQNKQFSFNKMIKPVRHHLSRFKFF